MQRPCADYGLSAIFTQTGGREIATRAMELLGLIKPEP
jgi:hypothetical protein